MLSFSRWQQRPELLGALPAARRQATHYLLGCRYWCVNMLSSLSNQPALFLWGKGYFVARTAANR